MCPSNEKLDLYSSSWNTASSGRSSAPAPNFCTEDLSATGLKCLIDSIQSFCTVGYCFSGKGGLSIHSSHSTQLWRKNNSAGLGMVAGGLKRTVCVKQKGKRRWSLLHCIYLLSQPAQPAATRFDSSDQWTNWPGITVCH
jgi:hypothetical protein